GERRYRSPSCGCAICASGGAGLCKLISWVVVRLGDGLAFLATNALGVLANDAHALTLVGFRRIISANFCCDLTDELLVRALDLQLGLISDGDLDALRNVVEDGMGVSQRQVD